MKTTTGGTILLLVLGLTTQAPGQNGQVRFQGTVTTDEAHDVVPVCYGDYHVTVAIEEVLQDPNRVLESLASVQVCYEEVLRLAAGDVVEVYGYYWGGICPKQYCNRVQILGASDYIRAVTGYGDNDWMVSGRQMYAIPPGNVGIGTSRPEAKLHVVGDTLIETKAKDLAIVPLANGGAAAPLHVVREGPGRQLVAYFSNPQDGAVEVEVQLAGGTMLPWGWSLRAASGMFSLGSVAVFPPALNVKSTGYLGLGDTDPSYRLELPNTAGAAGQARANAWRTYSSARWKTNVRPIADAMDKVRSLRGVYFDWKDGGVRDIGMVAEEVGRVIPEVVDYEDNGTDACSLAYDRLVAVLVEALKEQDARIAELEAAVAQNKQLEQRLELLERLVPRPQVPHP